MLITLDFESFYDTGYGFKNLTTEEYVRHPLFEVIGFSLKVDDQPASWHTGTMQEMFYVLNQFDWSKVAMCAHNARFDAAVLAWKFGLRPAKYLDTLSMARGIVGLKTGLSLAKLGQYFNLQRVKGEEVVKALGKRRLDFSCLELSEYGRYCINDTEMCYDLLQIMAPMTLPDELKLQDWTIRCFAEPKLLLDQPVLHEELRAYHARKDKLLLDAGIADVAVLRSDATMAQILQKLGVEPPTKLSPKQKNADGSKKRVFAFSRQDIEFMELLESDDENVVAAVEARLGVKSSILQSRIERLIGISQRGLLPVPLAYAGATPTRRWAGEESINLQNLPRNKLKKGPDNKVLFGPDNKPIIDFSPLRRAICAPPGKKMASADLSQIELRVNAWQSGQYDVLDILRSGGDVYSDMATSLYGYEVTKESGKAHHAQERFVGKTTELQCGYQCGGPKFIHSLKVAAKRDGMVLADDSLEFGERVVNGYRAKRRKITNFWYKAGDALSSLAYGMSGMLGPYEVRDYKLFLPNGSHLYYPDLRYLEKEGEGEQGCEWSYERMWKGRLVRKKIYGGKLVENITQAVARLFVSDALLRLETVRYPDGRRVFDIVFSVHDELVVLFDEWLDEAWVKTTLKWALTTPAVWAPGLPLECEIGIGMNYADCK